jgi:hypothetical protein
MPSRHQPEQRQQQEDQEPDDDEQHGHGHPDEPGQPGVFAEGHDDAADAHDRGGHHEVEGHQHEHLHLLHVIGAAGDQGGRAEAAELEGAERVDLAVHLAAQVTADGHGGAGAEVDPADGGDHLHQADDQHGHAGGPDEVGVAAGDALVDDLRVQAREVQRGDGGDQLQQEDPDDPGAVRPGVAEDQGSQYQGVSSQSRAAGCPGEATLRLEPRE